MWAIVFIQILAISVDRFTDGSLSDISGIWSYYLIVVIPVIGYAWVYWKLRNHFTKMIDNMENEEDASSIRKSLREMRLFFIAIVQYQAFRATNTYVRYHDSINNSTILRSLATGILYVSEIIMIIALCHSMNYAMSMIKTEQIRPPSRMSTDYTESLFNEEEINSVEKDKLKRYDSHIN